MAGSSSRGFMGNAINEVKKELQRDKEQLKQAVIDEVRGSMDNMTIDVGDIKVTPKMKIVVDEVDLAQFIKMDKNKLQKNIQDYYDAAMNGSDKSSKKFIASMKVALKRGLDLENIISTKDLNQFEDFYKDFANSVNKELSKIDFSNLTSKSIDKSFDSTISVFKSIIKEAQKFGSIEKYLSGVSNGTIKATQEMNNLLETVKILSNGKYNFSGLEAGTKHLDGIVSDKYTVIARSSEYEEKTNALIPKLREAEAAGVKLGTIIGTVKDEANGLFYEIQKTQQGKPINSDTLDYLQATDEQIIKLRKDLETLQKIGLYIDVGAGAENILYGKDGFSFIDLAIPKDLDKIPDYLTNSIKGITDALNESLPFDFSTMKVDEGISEQFDRFANTFSNISEPIISSTKDVDNNLDSFGDAVKDTTNQIDENITNLKSKVDEYNEIISGMKRPAFHVGDIKDEKYNSESLPEIIQKKGLFQNIIGSGLYVTEDFEEALQLFSEGYGTGKFHIVDLSEIENQMARINSQEGYDEYTKQMGQISSYVFKKAGIGEESHYKQSEGIDDLTQLYNTSRDFFEKYDITIDQLGNFIDEAILYAKENTDNYSSHNISTLFQQKFFNALGVDVGNSFDLDNQGIGSLIFDKSSLKKIITIDPNDIEQSVKDEITEKYFARKSNNALNNKEDIEYRLDDYKNADVIDGQKYEKISEEINSIYSNAVKLQDIDLSSLIPESSQKSTKNITTNIKNQKELKETVKSTISESEKLNNSLKEMDLAKKSASELIDLWEQIPTTIEDPNNKSEQSALVDNIKTIKNALEELGYTYDNTEKKWEKASTKNILGASNAEKSIGELNSSLKDAMINLKRLYDMGDAESEEYIQTLYKIVDIQKELWKSNNGKGKGYDSLTDTVKNAKGGKNKEIADTKFGLQTNIYKDFIEGSGVSNNISKFVISEFDKIKSQGTLIFDSTGKIIKQKISNAVEDAGEKASEQAVESGKAVEKQIDEVTERQNKLNALIEKANKAKQDTSTSTEKEVKNLKQVTEKTNDAAQAQQELIDVQKEVDENNLSSDATSLPSQMNEITQAEDRMGNEAQEATNQAKQGLAEMREEAEKTEETIVGFRKYFSGNGFINTRDAIAWLSSVEEIAKTYKGDTLAKAVLDSSKILTVDAKGADFGNITYNGQKMDTDQIAEYARQLGYLGVQIKNVKDAAKGGDVLSDTIAIFNKDLILGIENAVDDAPIIIEKKFKIKPLVDWITHREGGESPLTNDANNYTQEESEFANKYYAQYANRIGNLEETKSILNELETGIISVEEAWKKLDSLMPKFKMPSYADSLDPESFALYSEEERKFFEDTSDVAGRKLKAVVEQLESGTMSLKEAYEVLGLLDKFSNETPVSTDDVTSELETEKIAAQEATEAIKKKNEAERESVTSPSSDTTEIEKQTEANLELADAMEKVDEERMDDAVGSSIDDSVQNIPKETDELNELKNSAQKASEAKQEFADANGKVLSSIIESLSALNSEGNGFENLNKIINKLSNENKSESLVKNLKAIQNVLNESVTENSMISAIKDLANQGENLEAVATVLKATKTQVENAKKAVSTKSSTKADTSVEDARNQAIKEYITLLNRKNKLEAQNISKSKNSTNVDREKEIARITEEITKLNVLNLTEEEYARVTRETADSRATLTDAQNKANDEAAKQDEVNAKVLDNYKDSIQGTISSLDLLESKRKYTSTFSSEISELKSELFSLQTNSEGIDIVSEDEISQLDRIIAKVKELSKQATIAENKAANENSIQKNLGKINDVLSSNTKRAFKVTDVYKDYVRLQETFKNFDASRPQSELNELITELLSVDARFKELDDSVKGGGFLTQFTHRLSDMNAKFIAQYFSFQDIIRYARSAITTITELNDAFIELSKVSNTSIENLESDFQSYANIAKDIGGTISDTISATADWARMGYNIPDSKQLAEVAMLYKNVGDGIDITTANQSLISTLQGYQMQADEAEHIVDVFNEVANNFAIDSAGIGEALQRSASSLNAANTSLEESVALVTAANTVVQNPESVGTTFKTLSARIRGATTELADLGEEEDEFTQTTSKLQGLIKSLTGFDILESDQKTFKSIYDILIGIGKEWKNLDDIERASLGEALAGKRNANTLYAVLDNIETLESAYQKAEDSAGSAQREQENYQKGITYSINQAKAGLQELAYDAMDSDFLKGLVDTGTNALEIIDKIIDSVGLLKAALIGVGTVIGSQKLG